ncbi:MAG: hypothetical protein WKG32_03995 [Gemmatimonadaceae bacterium]
MELWIGIVTFVAGVTLWHVARRERAVVPTWLPRLAIGVTALGLSTLAATQPGLGWKVSSISFSIVAIALIITVIRDNLRGRR